MDIGGGNTTDDPVDYGELVAANQRGESKDSNKHRTEKHFEERYNAHQVYVLYIQTNRSRAQRPGTTQLLIFS
jgi:hypothetical protein